MRNIWKLVLFVSLIINGLFAEAPTTVSTFESIGIYWSPEGGSSNLQVFVKFREAGTSYWREGLPMKYNPIGGTTYELTTYRGSVVNLHPNTIYEIELTLEGTTEKDTIVAKTWAENFPISDTITIGNRTIPYSVYNSGTANGYILIDGTGSTIDVDNNYDYCITVRGSYVILRGLTLKNAIKSGIELKTCHDVIIENCDISGWGEKDDDGFGVNYQAGIFSNSTSIKRIVIQRCKIHHPRYDSNSWAELNNGGYHPSGPQGITFFNSGGNNVIRYNEIWSDSLHMFNDIIGAGTNGSYIGFPGPDSDIYSNYFANCWDDGIESEGGNRNVRIWGNFLDETFLPIANAATSIGPLYIWKNTSNRCYSPPGSYYGQDAPFIKMGFASSIDWMTGHMYIFNNTILQPNNEGAGGLGTSDNNNRYIKHCQTRNNILHVKTGTTNSISIREENTDNDYDYDLYNKGYPSENGGNAINGTPTYINGAAFDYNNMTANFFLTSSSQGYDAGVVIPNFADDYEGNAPDIGAFEAGKPPMEYGVNAYIISGIYDKKMDVPNTFSLLQNYPNPFNPVTTIRFVIPDAGHVKLAVYNVLGQVVRVAVDEKMRQGEHSLILDGSSFSSGVYFYRLEYDGVVKVRKMMLIK
jgi:hypothetical protein